MASSRGNHDEDQNRADDGDRGEQLAAIGPVPQQIERCGCDGPEGHVNPAPGKRDKALPREEERQEEHRSRHDALRSPDDQVDHDRDQAEAEHRRHLIRAEAAARGRVRGAAVELKFRVLQRGLQRGSRNRRDPDDRRQ